MCDFFDENGPFKSKYLPLGSFYTHFTNKIVLIIL
jgi:hypothetical protein